MAKSELAEFDAVFSEIVEELTKSGLKASESEDAFAWFKEVSTFYSLQNPFTMWSGFLRS